MPATIMDEFERDSSEVSRLSYQISTFPRRTPGVGNRIVDVNGEVLGTTNGLGVAERYRLALVNAVSDGGVRAMCAAGRRCNHDTQCGFCADGLLRPAPEDGHEHYPSAVVQSRALWGVKMDELLPTVLLSVPFAQLSSFGAMLLAAHVQGHNCLSAAFSGVFPADVPHEVNTLAGVASWARACKFKLLKTISAERLLMVVRIADRRLPDTVAVTHVFAVPVTLCRPFAEISVDIGFYSLAVQVHTYDKALRSTTLSVVVDVGYDNPLQNECISAKCSSMPVGYHFCVGCGFSVKSNGHFERCRPNASAFTKDILLARAQVGDIMHSADIINTLIARRVPSSERTIRRTEYCAGAAQASFMRFAGYEGPDAVLSTWFEACYDYLRPYYWEVTFGVEPQLPVIPISQQHPSLDPEPHKSLDCVPDYRSAWRHVSAVSSLVVNMPDDPVVVAVNELRSGNHLGKIDYMMRYTSLPALESLAAWSVRVPSSSTESLEAGCCFKVTHKLPVHMVPCKIRGRTDA